LMRSPIRSRSSRLSFSKEVRLAVVAHVRRHSSGRGRSRAFDRSRPPFVTQTTLWTCALFPATSCGRLNRVSESLTLSCKESQPLMASRRVVDDGRAVDIDITARHPGTVNAIAALGRLPQRLSLTRKYRLRDPRRVRSKTKSELDLGDGDHVVTSVARPTPAPLRRTFRLWRRQPPTYLTSS
jgi:hypothetical protein